MRGLGGGFSYYMTVYVGLSYFLWYRTRNVNEKMRKIKIEKLRNERVKQLSRKVK